MARQPSVDQQLLLDLLCADMTETQRARKLGIARSSYYSHLDRLVREGVLKNRGALAEGMTYTGAHPRSRYSATHHAPVMHVHWPMGLGKFSVQGALLDPWDEGTKSDIVVVVRVALVPGKSIDVVSFMVTPPARWSTKHTRDAVCPVFDGLSRQANEMLTIGIAKVLDAEAVLLPEGAK